MMKYFRVSDGWGRVLTFGCFVAAFLLAPSKTDEFYLAQSGADLGAQLLFRGWQVLLHWFNSHPGAFARDLFAFQAAIMFLFALLILLPDVPLLVAIGGEVTLLLIWYVFGDISAQHHAIESWTVVLVAMFMVAVAYWKGSPRDYLVAAAYGLVLGYMPLMRQSASFIVLLPCAVLAACGVIIATLNVLLLRRKDHRKPSTGLTTAEAGTGDIQPVSNSLWSFRGHALSVLVMLVLFFATQYCGNRLSREIYNAPIQPHGTGYPLFSSLGFANNAYNTAWDDDGCKAQGLLVEGVYWTEDSYGQQKLTHLWFARVLEDPALFLRGAIAKSRYLLQYFSGTLNPFKTQVDFYPMRPSWATRFLGIGFCLAAAGCARAFFRWRSDQMLVLFAGALGLLSGSFLPLVMIAPFYLGSAIACSVALFFIVLPAAGRLGRETKETGQFYWERNTFFYKCAGSAALVLLLSFSSFLQSRSIINRFEARRLVAREPAQAIEELGYRYSHRFNRLPIGEQQKVVDRLLSPEYSPWMFCPLHHSEADRQKIITPILAFIGDGASSTPSSDGAKILFVVVRMSRNWKMVLPSRVQGPRNSVLVVLKNVDRGAGVHYPFEAPGKFLKIADANWDGRYRMFCLPEPPDIADGAKFFNVSAYNFKDGEHSPRGLVLDLISGNRLYSDREKVP